MTVCHNKSNVGSMIRIIIAFLLIFGALPAQPQTQSWGDITWVTEEFPPWSFTENGEVRFFDVLCGFGLK